MAVRTFEREIDRSQRRRMGMVLRWRSDPYEILPSKADPAEDTCLQATSSHRFVFLHALRSSCDGSIRHLLGSIWASSASTILGLSSVDGTDRRVGTRSQSDKMEWLVGKSRRWNERRLWDALAPIAEEDERKGHRPAIDPRDGCVDLLLHVHPRPIVSSKPPKKCLARVGAEVSLPTFGRTTWLLGSILPPHRLSFSFRFGSSNHVRRFCAEDIGAGFHLSLSCTSVPPDSTTLRHQGEPEPSLPPEPHKATNPGEANPSGYPYG